MDYYASGKLLLFGEYLVLKGAKSLSVPLKYGQKMEIVPENTGEVKWVSKILTEKWFSAKFTDELELIESTDKATADSVLHLLKLIRAEKPSLFTGGLDFHIEADFPMEWGFGSSSTLISLLAQWSEMNPFYLLKNSFGGSGYDVACATANSPIVFETGKNSIKEVDLSDNITRNLLFVYSGNKQTSRKEVLRFGELPVLQTQIQQMNQLIDSVLACKEMEEFESFIEESEHMLSQILLLEPIKNSTFSNYPYCIKSLGAWGGDFFMASFREEKAAREYFSNMGYEIQFNYDQIIKR